MVETDSLIFQQINNLAGQWTCLDAFCIFFAKYFEYILIGSMFLFLWKKWRGIFLAVLAAILARFGVVELIRFFWARPRPFIENNVNLLINEVSGPAFPSGHATFYFALSFVVYKYNKKAGILFFVASFLISISRVFVGVHWPSDILAGAVIGVFAGWLITKLFKRFYWASYLGTKFPNN